MSEISPFLSEESKRKRISIILADDHPLMREALRMWIHRQSDLEIIAEANDGREAVEITNKLKPDVVIMDIGLPKLSGLEATKQITALSPDTKVLILSVHIDEEHILSALRAGASGYLAKDISGEEIIHAIRSILIDENDAPVIISRNITKNPSIKVNANNNTSSNPNTLILNKLEKLDSREITILKFAASGMTNKDIALRLGLSLRNVKSIFTTIFLKLCVSSRTEAIAFGLKNGIISLDDLER